MGDGYVGTAQDAVRIRRLEKQREAERRKIQELKNKTASAKGQPGLLQFGSSTSEVLSTISTSENPFFRFLRHPLMSQPSKVLILVVEFIQGLVSMDISVSYAFNVDCFELDRCIISICVRAFDLLPQIDIFWFLALRFLRLLSRRKRLVWLPESNMLRRWGDCDLTLIVDGCVVHKGYPCPLIPLF